VLGLVVAQLVEHHNGIVARGSNPSPTNLKHAKYDPAIVHLNGYLEPLQLVNSSPSAAPAYKVLIRSLITSMCELALNAISSFWRANRP
jgi:hypothetical protein